MIEIVWEFLARPGLEAEFERAYGPAGAWSRLYGRSPAFRGTRLTRDLDRPGRYLLVDRWDSLEASEAAKAAWSEEWHALDRRCEALTASEALLHRGERIA